MHPVSTAGSSLARFRAGKQTGIGFIDLDELGEVIDAEGCKCGCRFFAEAENAETTVFRIQYDTDLVEPLLILAEHFSISATRLIVKIGSISASATPPIRKPIRTIMAGSM